MPSSNFKAIEEYLVQCERILLEDAISPDTSCTADQKVPQCTSSGIIGEDKMLSQSSKYALQMNNSFRNGTDYYDIRLPSLGAVPCTPVGDLISDQQLTCEETPKFLDLDTVGTHDYDDTFYDDVTVKIKSEPISTYDDDHYTAYCRDTSSSPDDSNGLDCSYSQMVSVEDFLISHIKREIETTCTQLNISPDPNTWSPEHTTKWLVRTLQQYNKPIANLDSLYMDGARLCLLKEEEFKYRCPSAGSVLFSQLEIWKSACVLVEPFTTSPVHHASYYGGAASPSQSPIYQPIYQELVSRPVPSVSPVPSNSSLDAVSSSSQSMDEEFGLNFGYNLPEPEREPRQTIHLWQFLKELLVKPHAYGNCIKWIDRVQGIFKIEDSSRVAKLWGQRKNRPAMNYDKLSRSIRQYYKKGIIKKTEHSKRLVYQFCKPYLL